MQYLFNKSQISTENNRLYNVLHNTESPINLVCMYIYQYTQTSIKLNFSILFYYFVPHLT
jgi:hypothetical protein